MAKQIDKQEVKLGQLIRVQNLQKKPNQNEIYVALQVEDQDGNNERCLLFQQVVLSDMPKVELSLDLIFGRLYKMTVNKQSCYLIKVKNYNGEERILKISKKKLQRAQKLASKNPQDLTKKSLMVNIFD